MGTFGRRLSVMNRALKAPHALILGAMLTLGVSLVRNPVAAAPYDSGLGELATCPVPKLKDARVALGRRLFEEKALSRDSSLSCATCHNPASGFAESRPVSRGIGSNAQRRNTPTLIDVAVSRTSFNWDGKARTLEEQLLEVFSESGDMGISLVEAVERLRRAKSYRTQFSEAYHRQPEIADLQDALARFQEQHLVDGRSRFERFYLEGDSTVLDLSEQRGWALFRAARSGCAGCHVPLPDRGGSGRIMFRDNRFHNLGVGYGTNGPLDSGRFLVTGRPRDEGAFATPTLRNVALTAPYMHDGSIGTLKEVVDFYARGGNSNPHLDAVMEPRAFSLEERADLVAFMGSLSTPMLADSMAVRRCYLPLAR